MKNFKAKFMGFIKNISEGVIFGNFVATVIFQIFCVFLALIGEPDFFNITAFYLALDVVVIISAFSFICKNQEVFTKLMLIL